MTKSFIAYKTHWLILAYSFILKFLYLHYIFIYEIYILS